MKAKPSFMCKREKTFSSDKEMELEHPLGKGWFIGKGLKPKVNVVVEGAQQLLSEEFKGETEGE